MVAGQSVCAEILRRDTFSAGVAAGCEQSVPVSPPGRRIGMRADLEVDGDRGNGDRCVEEKRHEACDGDGGYYGAGEGGDVSDRCEIAESGTRAFGEESTCGGFEASPKLCASRSETTFQGESLCACASNEADEGGGEEIAHDFGSCGA